MTTRRLPTRPDMIQGQSMDASVPGLKPLSPNAPQPTNDWDSAMGFLFQSRNSVTKIVIELGDSSRILYLRD